MEPRKLRKLLETLQAFGVTSYHDADLTLQFGPAMVQVPDGDVEDQTEGLKLPPGVVDPRDAIRALYEKAEKRRKGAS
jgi:hypothetical protein